MSSNYTPLPQAKLNSDASLIYPVEGAAAEITLDSPAISVMTDFERVEPVTTQPTVSMSSANQKMMKHGIRLLLVLDQDDSLVGVITATDILGEKPVQYMHRVGCTVEDIQVQDIMTPVGALEVLSLDDVDWASVGQILETLKRDGRQHALVVDGDESEEQCIVGIFSATQISRLMNVRVEIPEVANSFAEIEAVIAH